MLNIKLWILTQLYKKQMVHWKHQSLGTPWTEGMESYEYQVPVLHVSSFPLEGNINSSITSFYRQLNLCSLESIFLKNTYKE